MAERARLEIECTGKTCTEGSNPSLSVLVKTMAVTVLGGELAVPCNPQTALAGLNSQLR